MAISLARCKDRRESIRNEVMKAGLDLELVEAIDASDFKTGDVIDYEALLKVQPCHLDENGMPRFNAAEIAIYASHLKAYRRVLELGLDYAFVLEDDAGVIPGCRIGSLGLIEALQRIPDWFYCAVHNCLVPSGNSYIIRTHEDVLCEVNEAPLGGVAAVVSRRFCEVITQEYAIMNVPIDQLICHATSRPEDRCFQSAQYMFSSGAFQSHNFI